MVFELQYTADGRKGKDKGKSKGKNKRMLKGNNNEKNKGKKYWEVYGGISKYVKVVCGR